VLNILPIPPLDGSRVLAAFVPGPWAYKMSRYEMYGLIVVAILIFTGILGAIISPPIHFLSSLIESLFGL
jgi:Zn-dependent protease